MSQLTVRIQASHIRKMLLRRNQSATFRRLLSGLSDEQLLQMDREHHAQAHLWRGLVSIAAVVIYRGL